MLKLVKPKKRKDVYNITVEDQHEYYACNILVANSTVYWRVGMDKMKGTTHIFKPEKSLKLGEQGVEIAPDGSIPSDYFKRKRPKDWRKM